MPLKSGQRYVLINRAAGTALDVDVNSKMVQGWARHGGPNQQWIFSAWGGEGGNYWTIKNVQLDNSLSFTGPAKDGQRLVCNTENQEWDITESDGAYRIYARHTEECVDLADHGNAEDGTAVQLWTSWGGDNQKWEAQEV